MSAPRRGSRPCSWGNTRSTRFTSIRTVSRRGSSSCRSSPSGYRTASTSSSATSTSPRVRSTASTGLQRAGSRQRGSAARSPSCSRGEKLADATAGDPPEFTLSRQIRGVDASFRCDLALRPASWSTTSVVAAHETRTGPDAFTDHSGIVLRVGPLADRPNGQAAGRTNRARQRPALRGGTGTDPTAAASFKTAIARRRPSVPATTLRSSIEAVIAESARAPSVRAVLDYGCGRGADVEYFRSLGMDAVGYDPHVPFGFAESPTGLFTVVTLIFVLNVLPTVEARLEVLRGAAARLAPDGVLIVATRSSAAVRDQAARSGWRAWGMGSSLIKAAALSSTGWTSRSSPTWARCSACGRRVRSRRSAMRPSWVSHDNCPRRGAPDHGLSPRVTEPRAACRRPDHQTRALSPGRAGDRFSDHRGLSGVIASATE